MIAGDGATLSVPNVTSLTHATTGNGQTMRLRAEGFGSTLDLHNITSLTGGQNYDSRLVIESLSGGVVDLSGVQTISETNTGDLRYRRFELLSEGVGSQIDLQNLMRIEDVSFGSLSGSNRFSTIESRYGGALIWAATRPAARRLSGSIRQPA